VGVEKVLGGTYIGVGYEVSSICRVSSSVSS